MKKKQTSIKAPENQVNTTPQDTKAKLETTLLLWLLYSPTPTKA